MCPTRIIYVIDDFTSAWRKNAYKDETNNQLPKLSPAPAPGDPFIDETGSTIAKCQRGLWNTVQSFVVRAIAGKATATASECSVAPQKTTAEPVAKPAVNPVAAKPATQAPVTKPATYSIQTPVAAKPATKAPVKPVVKPVAAKPVVKQVAAKPANTQKKYNSKSTRIPVWIPGIRLLYNPESRRHSEESDDMLVLLHTSPSRSAVRFGFASFEFRLTPATNTFSSSLPKIPRSEYRNKPAWIPQIRLVLVHKLKSRETRRVCFNCLGEVAGAGPDGWGVTPDPDRWRGAFPARRGAHCVAPLPAAPH
ncbi:hypothetical protein B0H11DRAFT_1899862 [Mycena galericulata]|nr:hypothetical protein B0H11DRAFT_1899862 [Mycena galericulata]